MCSISVMLDGVHDVPMSTGSNTSDVMRALISVSNVSVAAVSVHHTLTATLTSCDDDVLHLWYDWQVLLNYVDMQVSGSSSTGMPSWVNGTVHVTMMQRPDDMVVVSLLLPLRPAWNELMTLSCMSNDSYVVIVSPSTLSVTRSSYDITIANNGSFNMMLYGVRNYVRDDEWSGFEVNCEVASSSVQ